MVRMSFSLYVDGGRRVLMVGSTPSLWFVTVMVKSTRWEWPSPSVATTANSYTLSRLKSVGSSKSGGLLKVSTPRPLLSGVMVKALLSDRSPSR